MPLRWLLALSLAFAALIVATDDAHAGKTWCVSAFEPGPGYNNPGGGPPTERDPCADSCFRGSSWHFHGFVRKDGACFSCWDESDNTCQDQAKDQFYYWIGDVSCDGTPIASYGSDDQGCTQDPATAPQPQPQPDPGNAIQPDPGTGTPPVVVPDVAPAKKPLPIPPKPKPTDYQGVIVKVAPGPYAVNTPITIVGGVTVAGNPKAVRRVVTGDFVVLGPDGAEVARVHGKPKGRNVVALISIPVGGAVTVRFEPKNIVTASSEKLNTIAPAQQPLTVAGCRVQAALDGPTAGEILVADASTALRGHFVDAGGQPATAAALNGAKPIFVVQVGDDDDLQLDATVDAAGVATATVTIAKPEADVAAVHVRLIADGGQNDVCPSADVEAKTTALGVGIEITPDPKANGKPRQCYVGRPCPVTARFRLPTDPTARALGVRFVTSPGLALTSSAGGAAVALTADHPGAVDALWKGTVIPGDAGDVTLVVNAKSTGGEVTDQTSIDVKEPIELHLAPTLDLGTVPAGSPANARCVDLSFKASRGVLYEQFRLTATRPSGCASYLTVYDAGKAIGAALYAGATVEIGDARTIRICLAAVPRCGAESPKPAILTVAALSDDFPEQQAEVAISWKVSGRSLLACWWWLIAIVGGGLFVVVVGYGFVRPWRFAVDDQVQLASKREQLARAVGRRLRDLPGGRAGWYRSGAVGLLDNGQATAKLGTALVELHARRGEVIIRCRGGLERVSPQTKKLEPVAEAASKDGHVASKNVVYSAGALFFQLK